MVGHGGSSAGSYLADPTSPIPSHCASIVMASTLRVKNSHMLPAISLNLYKQVLLTSPLTSVHEGVMHDLCVVNDRLISNDVVTVPAHTSHGEILAPVVRHVGWDACGGEAVCRGLHICNRRSCIDNLVWFVHV